MLTPSAFGRKKLPKKNGLQLSDLNDNGELNATFQVDDISNVLLRKGRYTLLLGLLSLPVRYPLPYTKVLIDSANAAGVALTTQNLKFFDFVFIFDEAFHYHDLWLGFVKTQSDTNLGPRICVFSSYGSPTVAAEGFDYDCIKGSPLAHLGVQQRVSIAVSVIEDSPSICLFYTRTEFEDAVRRLCTRVRKPLPLHKGAIDYIFTLTKGHPGAVKAVVKMIQKVSRAVYFCFRSLTALPRGYQARNN